MPLAAERTLAKLKLLPAKFAIEEPAELAAMTKHLIDTISDYEESRQAVYNLWKDCYVICATEDVPRAAGVVRTARNAGGRGHRRRGGRARSAAADESV